MSQSSVIKSLHSEYLKLPSHIKEWLSSDQLIYKIDEMDEKFNLGAEKIPHIPKIILRIAIKDINPVEVMRELSRELNISFQSAKMLAEEILVALKPVENDLRRDLGIDLGAIQFGKPEPQQTNPEMQPAKTNELPWTSETPTVDLQSFKIKSERPLSPLTFTSGISVQAAPAMKEEKIPTLPILKKEDREIPAMPFILHRETPTVAPFINPTPSETPTMKSSLTMKVQNFYQSSSAPERPASKPVSIKVEVPTSDSNTQKTEQLVNINKQNTPPTPKPDLPQIPPPTPNNNEVRVVHYSDLRTPLNSFGVTQNKITKDNILDLRKLNN